MSTSTHESRAKRELRELIQSGRPLIYICSPEEDRVAQLIQDAAAGILDTSLPVCTWSLTEGAQWSDATAGSEEKLGPLGMLDFILQHEQPAFFHLKDFHEPLRDSSEVRRRMRDVYAACFDKKKFVVLSSPVKYIPAELEREMVYYELPVPDIAELVDFLRGETQSLSDSGRSVDASEGTLQQYARALQGLTFNECRHALRRALAMESGLNAESTATLLNEKKQLVGRTGTIEYIPDATGIDDMGGLATLKKWLLDRKKLFTMQDELSSDLVPKGVLVMGIAGCGKSLAVKAIASTFGLPLYRVNMTEVFSGRDGTPERVFAQTCRLLEEMSPAVVWFDEIEAGISTGSKSDETGRLFGFFLTWMQEKKRGLFVGATANRIDLLPAEMIRKGRFDEVFFVDLPGDAERIDIFKVHLKKRGVDASDFDLERLVKFTKGWSGAEIEQCVISAMTKARIDDQPLTAGSLVSMASTQVPLSKTMKEQVEQIRAWAFDRAMRAAPREMGQ